MKLLVAWSLVAFQTLVAAEGPEASAVRYLEKVRGGPVNLEPGGDTAIAARTVDEKREEIALRLKRLSVDLGKLPLVAGASRVDGDLAAVMVGQSAGNDFDAYQVTAVALVKRGGSWLPAPLPGLYQNAGLSYEPGVREQAAALENWMIEQKAVELARLREQEITHLRGKIEMALPAGEWRNMSPSQCAERFFKACENGQVDVLAGLLGGAAAPLPDDWSQSWKAAGQALASSEKAPRHWRLMMSPDVLRIPVSTDESGGRARVTVVCLDPAGIPPKFQKTRMEEISLELVKSADGLWTVAPPRAPQPPAGEGEALETVGDSTLDVLTGVLTRKFSPSAHSDPAAAATSLVNAFRTRSPARWVSHLKPQDDGDSARESLEAASAVWRSFGFPPASRHPVVMGDFGDGSCHVFVFQVFSSMTPDQLDLRELHFVKSDAGWFWEPCPGAHLPAEFKPWREHGEKQWSQTWRALMLEKCHVLGGFQDAKTPTAGDARATVERWSRSLRQGDVATAIGMTARLRLPDSEATLLRNLGYEINGTRSQSHHPEVADVLLADPWALVTLAPAPDQRAGFACLAVIQTPDGPKILLETDLVFSESRSRRYLNDESFERLAKSDLQASVVLKRLFSGLGRSDDEKSGK